MSRQAPRQPRRFRRFVLWFVLLAVVPIAAGAALWLLESRGGAPRLLGSYIERHAQGRNPVVESVGQRANALLRSLDRGAVGADLPLVPWSGAMASAPRPAHATTILAGTPEQLIGAIGQAQPGDVITLLPGTYRFSGGGAIGIDRGGREGAPITVRAERPGSVILEFDLLEGFHVRAPWWTFENLHIRGVCGRHSSCEHAFHVVGRGSHFVARNNTIVDFNAHFKINGEGGQPDHGLIAGNTLVNGSVRDTDNPVTPIDLVGPSGWEIRGNLIRDFIKGGGDRISYGAFAKGAGANNRFVGNTVLCEYALRGEPGQRVGLSLGGGGTGIGNCRDGRCIVEQEAGVLESNLIAYCSDAGIYLNRAAQSQLRHNTLLDTGGILLRGLESSADVDGNLVDGPVLAQGGAIVRDAGNLVTGLGRLYVGSHPVRELFANVAAFDLGWRAGPPLRDKPGAAVADLCGAKRPATPAYGAFEDFRACLAPRRPPASPPAPGAG